jgi:hypothetical protein
MHYSNDDPCDDWSRTPLPKPIRQQENGDDLPMGDELWF